MNRYFIVATMVAVTGCGSAPPRGDVAGSVSFLGKPVTDAQVAFTAQDGVPAVAQVDGEGKYRVQGVRYGDTIVTVVRQSAEQHVHMEQVNNARKEYGERLERGEKGKPGVLAPPRAAQVLPSKYADPNATPLRFTVSAPQNTFHIEMTR